MKKGKYKNDKEDKVDLATTILVLAFVIVMILHWIFGDIIGYGYNYYPGRGFNEWWLR